MYQGIVKTQLDIILENASTKDKNVIITNLNDAWVEPHSIFDLFLESFHIGNNTRRLVNHLVVVCVDEKAYNRCLALHPHCYHLRIEGLNSAGEAFFMSPDYLEIVWRKINFLAAILEKGYNFVFTVQLSFTLHNLQSISICILYNNNIVVTVVSATYNLRVKVDAKHK